MSAYRVLCKKPLLTLVWVLQTMANLLMEEQSHYDQESASVRAGEVPLLIELIKNSNSTSWRN